MATVEFHMETSQGFILQSETKLVEGRRAQASELGWDAAARAVKAVADLYGWRRDTPADLFRAVDNVVRLSGDPEIRLLFNNANDLHKNFYDGWLSDERIARNIERVKLLLTKLDAFMDGGGNGAGV